MFEEMKNDLMRQKASIESMGNLTSRGLEFNIETYVVTRNDRWYSAGKFGFSDPDEMMKAEAESIAFKTGAKCVSAKVYWDKKYKTVCDALSRFD